jgi:hypothetical protein
MAPFPAPVAWSADRVNSPIAAIGGGNHPRFGGDARPAPTARDDKSGNNRARHN